MWSWVCEFAQKGSREEPAPPQTPISIQALSKGTVTSVIPDLQGKPTPSCSTHSPSWWCCAFHRWGLKHSPEPQIQMFLYLIKQELSEDLLMEHFAANWCELLMETLRRNAALNRVMLRSGIDHCMDETQTWQRSDLANVQNRFYTAFSTVDASLSLKFTAKLSTNKHRFRITGAKNWCEKIIGFPPHFDVLFFGSNSI